MRRGLARLARQAREGRVDPATLAVVRRAWGNPGYTADVTFLTHVAERALGAPGPFLDCGSGLSTLIAATIAGTRRIGVWSLEQNKRWYRELSVLLTDLRIDNVALWYTPLRVYDGFVWYDLDRRTLPTTFGCVFCDGPAVHRSVWGKALAARWRSGLVPVLAERAIRFDEIVLDDVEDHRCPDLIERWQDAGLDTRVVESAHGNLLIARRPT